MFDKTKAENDQTAVPSGGGTVEDNSHPDQSIWGESSLHQTRGAPCRQHPQDPRLAGPHRPRQGPHHPARTAADQPARLPPRRLTGTSNPATSITSPPAGKSATPQASRSTRNRPAGTPSQARTTISAGIRARRHAKNQVTATVLSVTRSCPRGDLNPRTGEISPVR